MGGGSVCHDPAKKFDDSIIRLSGGWFEAIDPSDLIATLG